MRLHFLESLNPCIRDLANLLRPKILPFAAIKFIIESDNMARTCHINEGVAYIAFAAIAVTLIDAEVAVSIITYEEHFGQDKQ